MKCSNARKLASDHIDGLLAAGQDQNLKKHLDKCADCRAFLSDMRFIVNSAKGLDTLDPPDEIWPAIKSEILNRKRKPLKHPKRLLRDFPIYSRGTSFALATLFGIILLVPLLYYSLPLKRNTDTSPAKTALSNFQIAEQHYQSAIEALAQAIATQEVTLTPELMTVFKNNLAIIDDSIRICKASVGKSPGSRETNKLLLICYKKKIELLNEMKEITMRT